MNRTSGESTANQSAAAPAALDAQIEHALRALGSAEASPGLEQRTLSAVRKRYVAPTPVDGWASGFGRFGSLRGAALAVAAAVLVAVALGLISVRRPERSPVSLQARAAKPVSPVPGQGRISLLLSPSNRSAASGSPSLANPRGPNAARPHLRPLPPSPGPAVPPPQIDVAAADDLHAPSQLAPPLPLTPQERLIVRLMRRGQAFEMAQLDPAARAEAAATERTSFEKFFDPPLPPPPDLSLVASVPSAVQAPLPALPPQSLPTDQGDPK